MVRILVLMSLGVATVSAGPQGRPTVQSVAELRARTPEEKIRARRFDYPGLRRLIEVGNIGISLESNSRVLVGPPPPPGQPPPPTPPPDPLEWLRQRVCQSDLVLQGHATSQRVLLNRSETFLFTDYTMVVERAFRSPVRTPTVMVSLMGGEVELAGRTLMATAVPPLRFNRGYLLFLARIPGGAAYAITSLPLEIEPSTARLRPEELSEEVELDELLDQIERVATECRVDSGDVPAGESAGGRS